MILALALVLTINMVAVLLWRNLFERVIRVQAAFGHSLLLLMALPNLVLPTLGPMLSRLVPNRRDRTAKILGETALNLVTQTASLNDQEQKGVEVLSRWRRKAS